MHECNCVYVYVYVYVYVVLPAVDTLRAIRGPKSKSTKSGGNPLLLAPLLSLSLLLSLLLLLLLVLSLWKLAEVRRYWVMFCSTEEENRLVMGKAPQAMALSNVMQPVSGKLVGYNRNPVMKREGEGERERW